MQTTTTLHFHFETCRFEIQYKYISAYIFNNGAGPKGHGIDSNKIALGTASTWGQTNDPLSSHWHRISSRNSLTCSSLYNAFKDAEELIITEVLNEIDVEVFPEAFIAQKLTVWTKPPIFAAEHLKIRQPITSKKLWKEVLPLSRLAKYVDYFAADFALKALDARPPVTLPPSREELNRIRRAFIDLRFIVIFLRAWVRQVGLSEIMWFEVKLSSRRRPFSLGVFRHWRMSSWLVCMIILSFSLLCLLPLLILQP